MTSGVNISTCARWRPPARRRRSRAGRPPGTSGRSAAASASPPTPPPRRPTVRAARSPTTTRTTRRASPASPAAGRRRTTCGSASARRPVSASPTTRRAGRCAGPARGVRGSRSSTAHATRARPGRPPSRRRWCPRRPSRPTGPASRTPDSSNVSRTAAQTSARASSVEQPERRRPVGDRRPRPGDVLGEVARVDAAAGEDAHAGRERHRRLPTQQVDLGPRRAVAHQHDGRGVARLGRGGLAGLVGARLVDERLREGGRFKRQPATSTMSSTSTGTSSGSTETPTAERAWRPMSPNTSARNSEAPLATFG